MRRFTSLLIASFVIAAALLSGCDGGSNLGHNPFIEPSNFEVDGRWSGSWVSNQGAEGTWSVRFFCAVRPQGGCLLSWEGEFHGASCSAAGDFVEGSYNGVEGDLLSFNGQIGEGPGGPGAADHGFITLRGTKTGGDLFGTYMFFQTCDLCSCDLDGGIVNAPAGNWTLSR